MAGAITCSASRWVTECSYLSPALSALGFRGAAGFEATIDLILPSWAADPGMHVYQHAPYEPAAVKRDIATRNWGCYGRRNSPDRVWKIAPVKASTTETKVSSSCVMAQIVDTPGQIADQPEQNIHCCRLNVPT